MNKFYEVVFDEKGLLQEAFEISYLQIPRKFRLSVLHHGYARGYYILFLRRDKMEHLFKELFEKKNQKYLQWANIISPNEKTEYNIFRR